MTTALVVSDKGRDFHADRRKFIGGSDIAKILGLSKRGTAFDVWASKTGKLRDSSPDDDDDFAAAGRFLEPFIRDRFELKTGLRLHRKPVLVSQGICGGHPDDLALQPDGRKPFAVFEAKTRSPFLRGEWGDEGTDGVPPDELSQILWYCGLLDLHVGYAAVLFDRLLSIFRIQSDAEFFLIAKAAAEKFWKDHVEKDVPPPMRGLYVDEYIRSKFPHALAPLREPTPAEAELVALIMDMTTAEKAAAAAKDEYRADLKMLIGEAEGIRSPGLTVYFRDTKGRSRTDYGAALVAFKNTVAVNPKLNEHRKAEIIDALTEAVAHYTTDGEPYRTLRIYSKKGEL